MQNHLGDFVRAVIIRYKLQLRHRLDDDEVGEFTLGNATHHVAHAHGVGRVQSGGVQSLFRRQAVADAGHRHNELHVA